MEMNKKYKEVTIKGRKFLISKFDARTGSYMMVKLTGLIAPLFKNLDLKKLDAEKIKGIEKPTDIDTDLLNMLDISGFIGGISRLPEEDFRYIQDNCLKACSEMLPAGPAKVVNPDGTYGVLDIEDDIATIMALTVHALTFNITGFFGEDLLRSVLPNSLDLFQQDAKM